MSTFHVSGAKIVETNDRRLPAHIVKIGCTLDTTRLLVPDPAGISAQVRPPALFIFDKVGCMMISD